MKKIRIMIAMCLCAVLCNGQGVKIIENTMKNKLLKNATNSFNRKFVSIYVKQGTQIAPLTVRALPNVYIQRKYWEAIYRLPQVITPSFITKAYETTPSTELLSHITRQMQDAKNELRKINHYMTRLARYEQKDNLYETEQGIALQEEILAIQSLPTEVKQHIKNAFDDYDTEGVLATLANYYSLSKNYAFVESMMDIDPLLKNYNAQDSFVSMAVRYMLTFPGVKNYRLAYMIESPLVSQQLKDEINQEMEYLKKSQLTTAPITRLLNRLYEQYAVGFTSAKLSRSQTDLLALHMRLRAELEQFIETNGRIPVMNAEDILENELAENINSLLSEYKLSSDFQLFLDPVIDKEIERINNLLEGENN